MAYWLMKSEPEVYSIDQLKKDRRTCWDGVRNYQARNMLRDLIKKDDLVLFYHSNCDEPGIAGIARVVKDGYPDNSIYKGKGNKDPANPTWFMVDIAFQRKLKRVIPLTAIKADPKLKSLQLVQPGNRLSVMPISAAEYKLLLAME